MHPNRPYWSRLDVLNLVGLGLLALGFFGLWIDPRLQYLSRLPLFYPDATFFHDFNLRPGGLVEYTARYLAQWQAEVWPGALVAALGLMAVYGLVRLASGFGIVPRLFPALAVSLLIVVGARYDFPWLETAMGMVLWLAASAAFALVSIRGWPVRWLIYGLVVAGICWLVGPIPGGILVVVCALHEVIADKRWGTAAICVATGGLIVTLIFRQHSGLVAGVPVKSLQNWPVWLSVIVGLSYAAGWAGEIIFRQIPKWQSKTTPAKTKSHAPAKALLPLIPARFPNWIDTAVGAAFITFAFLIAGLTVDRHQRSLLEMERCAQRQDWPGFLALARQTEGFSKPLHLQLHRALFQQGQLLDQLFAFPQSTQLELLPGPEEGLEILPVLSATLLELGQPNLAEHWAHEALEAAGERPELLLLLAKINAVKGKLPAAKVFLNRLRQCPAGRVTAEVALREVSEPSAELLRLRSFKVNTDYPASRIPTSVLLQQALHANHANRMALEYLMAHYLLSVKPDLVVKHLGGFKGVAATALPRHIEEAVLAYQREAFLKTQKAPELDLAGFSIRSETRQRFERFLRLLAQHKGDVVAARPAMTREFGDTYWFYSIYETTAGAPASMKLEKIP